MAAPLGFKTFNSGDVLTAADTNGYLMQGVWTFANAAARTAAVTSPQEGNVSFLKDTNSLEIYDGATWVAYGSGDITGVTAGTGISGGGTSGTVTVTNSMATEIDAKGDLIVGTGADTFSRLAVGTNDHVLTADSSTATGLKWAAASGGGSFTSFTPTVKQGTTTMTLYTSGADGQNYYTTVGKWVFCIGQLYMNSTGTASQIIEMSLPINIDTTSLARYFGGSAFLFDDSASQGYKGMIGNNTDNSKIYFYPTEALGTGRWGSTSFTAALTVGDWINYSFSYRGV